ncbi:MAG: GntR family transcriptional regulator [Eubacterium sp.]|nr:GntR family transcriptional regulator [Eubacterium sp.]
MPKYLDIADVIEGRILDYTYNDATSPIPPELTLAEQFNVSRQTIRNALKYLEKKKLVYSIQGSGTFIVKENVSSLPPSKNVAVIMNSIGNYIYPFKSAAVNHQLAREGYIATIFSTENRLDYEARILDNLMGSNYAGIILEPSCSYLPRFDLKPFRTLMSRIPFILIDDTYRELDLPSIKMDDFAGGKLATEHLIANGHRKIFYVGRSDNGQGIRRFNGYLEALKKHRLPFSDDRVYWYSLRTFKDYFHETFPALLKQIRSCTAAFIYNDEFAQKLIPALQENGIRIPEDLSVVGYDNFLTSPDFDPPLTTIRYPYEEVGQKAAENLLRMMSDSQFDANYTFIPELIERESVRMIEPLKEKAGTLASRFVS